MGGLPPDLDLILSQPQLLWRFLIILEVEISVLVVNDNSYEQWEDSASALKVPKNLRGRNKCAGDIFFLGTQTGT